MRFCEASNQSPNSMAVNTPRRRNLRWCFASSAPHRSARMGLDALKDGEADRVIIDDRHVDLGEGSMHTRRRVGVRPLRGLEMLVQSGPVAR